MKPGIYQYTDGSYHLYNDEGEWWVWDDDYEELEEVGIDSTDGLTLIVEGSFDYRIWNPYTLK